MILPIHSIPIGYYAGLDRTLVMVIIALAKIPLTTLREHTALIGIEYGLLTTSVLIPIA
jgi:hypothetical protein